MKYIIAIYVVAMMLFWIEGEGTFGWNLYYYLIEKAFSASGFILLAFYVSDKKVTQLAIYAASICIFMILYWFYCMVFGHSSVMAITSLLFYSVIIVYLISRK